MASNNIVTLESAGVSDVKMGLKYLSELINILEKLEFVVLVGGAARRALVYLSHKTNVRIVGCHHPSPKVVNNHPEMVKENITVFRAIKNAQKMA